MNPYRNEFNPNQLKAWRKALGYKLKDVSEKTGISVSYLSDIERGRTYPSLKTLIALCDFYQISIMHVFVRKND